MKRIENDYDFRTVRQGSIPAEIGRFFSGFALPRAISNFLGSLKHFNIHCRVLLSVIHHLCLYSSASGTIFTRQVLRVEVVSSPRAREDIINTWSEKRREKAFVYFSCSLGIGKRWLRRL